MRNARVLLIVTAATSLAACNTIGQMTVRDYRAASGERVMAGQAEPKDDYRCSKVAEGAQDWGFKGNLDRASATQRITQAAVDAAPSKGANYVHVMTPSESSIGGFNVNAFADAKAAYYKCADLPAASN